MPRLEFPATQRNRDPILAVLRRFLTGGTVLEVASGSGEHALYFARNLPGVTWQPSDAEPAHLESITAWREHERLPNLLPPVALDVTATWPSTAYDAIFCANMIHIAPWTATLGLFAGAAKALRSGGLLLTYGPYAFDGAHTSDSNVAFDASLRARNLEWGVRDVADVRKAAPGFTLEEIIPMPANNFTLVWQKRSES